MKKLIIFLLCVNGVVQASNNISATQYCPVPTRHMKPEFFTISEDGKLAETRVKESGSNQITHVIILSDKIILDRNVIKNTLNDSGNDRLRTPTNMIGCNRCTFSSPYKGVHFYGCIQ